MHVFIQLHTDPWRHKLIDFYHMTSIKLLFYTMHNHKLHAYNLRNSPKIIMKSCHHWHYHLYFPARARASIFLKNQHTRVSNAIKFCCRFPIFLGYEKSIWSRNNYIGCMWRYDGMLYKEPVLYEKLIICYFRSFSTGNSYQMTKLAN